MNNFALPQYLENLSLTINDEVHNHNTRRSVALHQNRKNKEFTKHTVNYQIAILINYANEPNIPARYDDFVMTANSDKLKSKPKQILLDILDRVKKVSIGTFYSYCKKSFISMYE